MKQLLVVCVALGLAACGGESSSSGGPDGGGAGGATGGSGGATGGSGGATGGSGGATGGTAGTAGTGASGGSAGAGGSFACGTETCGATQLCIHPCCGGVPPPCEPMPEGGVCAPGSHQGCQYGGCSDPNGCCQMDPCTPPPPYCADSAESGCMPSGHDCYLMCA